MGACTSPVTTSMMPRAIQRLGRPPANLETMPPAADQIEVLPITRKRNIVFSESSDGETFFVDGKQFEMDRVDTEVELGDVEEWTITNVTGELHVFHIHQLDFLVTEVKGEQVDAEGLRDVVDVPYKKDGVPGEVKVIIPFTDPIIVGKFPYHCHILEHEDKGMMANLVVRPKGQKAGAAPH